jgi:SAM-dependent methyltransferase
VRWDDEPLWGSFYDWTVEHRRVGGLLWRLGVHSDLGRLYDAAAEIGRQPRGARVLDVPCGGGVAVRALRRGQGTTYIAADISPRMLERTARVAEAHGVADQVTTQVADVAALPHGDAAFDLVVSFTGLHCFPDPRAAVAELCRVTRVGGVVTGSAILNDDRRWAGLRLGGRLAGLLGPGCTRADVRRWLEAGGCAEVALTTSGALTYYRGVRVSGDPAPRTA